MDQFWELLISHKFIEECLITYEFGNHKAILPVYSHHEGKGHEDVGAYYLQKKKEEEDLFRAVICFQFLGLMPMTRLFPPPLCP